MVAHFITRTYGVNQAFRFVEGICLHRKSRQIRFFFGKYLFHMCATFSELPPYISTRLQRVFYFLTTLFRILLQRAASLELEIQKANPFDKNC